MIGNSKIGELSASFFNHIEDLPLCKEVIYRWFV